MKSLIVVIGLAIMISGCATYYSYVLPTNYVSEVEEVFNHFGRLNLKNKYSLKILSKEEMDNLIKTGSPMIDTSKNIIYLDDLYLKYLYGQKNGKFYHIRKRDLACIIAHEICHSEYNLVANNIAQHLEVDMKAIELLRNFNIDWHDYAGAIIRMGNYLETRRGDWSNFLRLGSQWTTGLTIGMIFFEFDTKTRFFEISRIYGGENWMYDGNLSKRTSEDFSRKDDWEFH